jgi:hypothetical protein
MAKIEDNRTPEEKKAAKAALIVRKGIPHKLRAYRIPEEGLEETSKEIKALLKAKRKELYKNRKQNK